MKTRIRNPLAVKPTRLRAFAAKGLASSNAQSAIDPTGGDNGAGLIRGAAICTVGEALGHGFWCDQTFIQQCASAMLAAGEGLKVRFTHPSLSSDGLASYLGRAKTPSIDGDSVRGDIHFAKSAHDTPKGKLAGYVMDRAEEDPTSFGMSVVFDHDPAAEEAFLLANGGRIVEDLEGFEMIIDFKSPDPANVDNFPHARLADLSAADVVGDPAANPDGLFCRGQEFAIEADALLSYSLGLTTEAPTLTQLDIDPDRTAQFVTRFLSHHNLEIIKKGDTMPNPAELAAKKAADDAAALAAKKTADEAAALEAKTKADAAAALEKASLAAAHKSLLNRLKSFFSAEASSLAAAGQKKCAACSAYSIPGDDGKCSKCGKQMAADDDGDEGDTVDGMSAKPDGKAFLAAFGQQGAAWFVEGKTFAEATALHVGSITKERDELAAKLKTLDVAGQFGEKTPLSSTPEPSAEDKNLSTMGQKLGDNLARFAAGIVMPKA